MLDEVQVEATFPDGRKLVTLAPAPSLNDRSGRSARRRPARMSSHPGASDERLRWSTPGIAQSRWGPISTSRDVEHRARVRSDRRRPDSGSMCPAGTSRRFEPGVDVDVVLVKLAGTAHSSGSADPTMSEISRERYAALYGPTTGDRVRLADTELVIEVERRPHRPARRRSGLRWRQDGARVDGPGTSSPEPRARPTSSSPKALVLDHRGIVKADVGIRDGRIVALGKAGNPDMIDGVHPDPPDRCRAPRSSRARAAS